MPELTVEVRMFLGLVTGLLVALVSIPPIVRVSHTKNLGARPNGRTSHNGQVPELGGIAIFAATVMGSVLFIDVTGFSEFRYILAAILIIFFIGLKDDLVTLRWYKKLIAEIIAAFLVVVLGGIRIATFHGMMGIGTLPYWFSILFSIFVFIALINCFNLLDGIDGLASGMGIAISLIFGYWLYRLGYVNFAILALAMAGGLISFYRYNVFGKHNKLFMGDTGSLLLGFLFAVLSIKILCCELPADNELYMRSLPTVVMGAMIVPIIDTIRVFASRIVHGRSPFSADRTHLHHVFLTLGFTHVQASTIIILINVFLFGMALAMRDMHALTSAAILFSSAFIITMIPCVMSDLRMQKQPMIIDDHHSDDHHSDDHSEK